MKRRDFISMTMLAGTALAFSPLFTGCNSRRFAIDKIIGMDAGLLEGMPKTGDDFFAFYELPKGSFTSEVQAGKAFVFTQENQIVGYTLVLHDLEKAKELKQTLLSVHGIPYESAENHQGTEYKWSAAPVGISLAIAGKKSMDEKAWYSVYKANTRLIMF